MIRLIAVCLLVESALAAGHDFAAAPTPPIGVDRCDTMVRDDPQSLAGYRCYQENSRKEPAVVRQRLEALLAKDPSNPAVQLYLGLMEWEQARMERVEKLLKGAESGFKSRNAAEGHVLASLGLGKLFGSQKRQAEALASVDEADKAAQRSGDSILTARVEWARALRAYGENDYSRAYSYFKLAETKVFPNGPYDVQSGVLSGLGSIAWATGKYREAMNYYSRGAEIKHQ